MASGEVWVQYDDSHQLKLSSGTGGVVHIDRSGHEQRLVLYNMMYILYCYINRYCSNDSLPEIVRCKLQQMPHILDTLMSS